MCYMSLSSNDTLIILSNINLTSNESFLVSSHNRDRINDCTAALISSNDVKLILCNQTDVRSCIIKRIIPFPSSLIEITRKISIRYIFNGIFIYWIRFWFTWFRFEYI